MSEDIEISDEELEEAKEALQSGYDACVDYYGTPDAEQRKFLTEHALWLRAQRANRAEHEALKAKLRETVLKQEKERWSYSRLIEELRELLQVTDQEILKALIQKAEEHGYFRRPVAHFLALCAMSPEERERAGNSEGIWDYSSLIFDPEFIKALCFGRPNPATEPIISEHGTVLPALIPIRQPWEFIIMRLAITPPDARLACLREEFLE